MGVSGTWVRIGGGDPPVYGWGRDCLQVAARPIGADANASRTKADERHG